MANANRVLTARPRKIALITGVLIVDLVIAIAIVELLVRVTGYNFGDSKYSGPIVFLQGEQTIFQSHGSAFTYIPHMLARSEHVFYSDSDYEVEFDYQFPTNNIGLVQDSDAVPGKKSVLVLGDSFTEGVGSWPWFTTLAPVIEEFGYQPINGGLRGTGFYMWWQLAQYLESRGLQIEKLVIVFTSPDYRARPMTFTEGYLRCLSKPILQNCDLSEYFFLPLPPREQLPIWVDEVRKLRYAQPPSEPRSTFASIKAKLEALMPATYRVYGFLKLKLSPPAPDPDKARAEIQSQAAIQALIERYGAKNLIFVHVPIKNEASPNPDGLKARQAISAAGGHLFDGFEFCGLSVSDYHLIDGHPTEAGYKKLSDCVAQAFKKLATN
jgi:hypothetical protein